MPSARARPNRIFAGDARRLGGVVSVAPGRDRVTSEPFYCVSHVSAGGDVVFQSRPIPDEDRALQAAQTLAEFTGAVVRR
jgi:hypothetical protein